MTIFASRLRYFSGSKFAGTLQNYFRSGWAFLIPYLAAYLLYAWLRWPVNPAPGGEGIVKGIGESGSVDGGLWSVVPPLLHLYWALHFLHLILGFIALRTSWRTQFPTSEKIPGFRSRVSGLWPVIPWLCLGLLFWIPGVYLEYPADTWAHYARINEWSTLDTARQHSAWTKSSYFLAYSFIGGATPPLIQLKCFDIYYAGCCLLLCWQYFRLARTVGLGECASMVFVLLQALLAGNSVFGFYRYYGMSSTVFSQLGAVALVRVAIEAATNSRLSLGSFIKPSPAGWSTPPARSSHSGTALLFAGLSLSAVTGANHVQGLGIVALGTAAVVAWRLIVWRRSMAGWLVLATLGLSGAVILWFPRDPAIDDIYRKQGWLSSWYGFNLFLPASPGFDRTLDILGAVGLFNLLAGCWFLRRNHVVGWLTVMPVIALSLPFVAIPYLQLLIFSDQAVLVFHRMLFAVPAGLALVTLGTHMLGGGRNENWTPITRRAAVALVPVGLCILLAVPAGRPGFNRLYNAVMRPPDDLTMRHVLLATENPDFRLLHLRPEPAFLAVHGISLVAHSTGFRHVLIPVRSMFAPPWDKTYPAEVRLASIVHGKIPAIFLLQRAYDLYTPLSLTGYLSHHWHSHEVAFEHTRGPEFERQAIALGYASFEIGNFHYLYYLPR